MDNAQLITDLTIQTLKKDIVDCSDYEQEEWLLQTGQLLSNWETIEDYSIMKQAEILYRVWSLWDMDNNSQGLSLKRTATYRWAHDFYQWAKSYTKFRASRLPSQNTIDNKIGVYRDYIAEQLIEFPETVRIPKRDQYGQLVDKNLESDESWEVVLFDPAKSDYGKLLIARGSAKKGLLGEQSWAGIMDPFVSTRELKNRIKQDINGNGDEEEDFHIEEQDGIIYGVSEGHRVAVLQALWENSADPLFSKTLSHIFASAGLKLPLGYNLS